jgi:hypothetical protein
MRFCVRRSAIWPIRMVERLGRRTPSRAPRVASKRESKESADLNVNSPMNAAELGPVREIQTPLLPQPLGSRPLAGNCRGSLSGQVQQPGPTRRVDRV